MLNLFLYRCQNENLSKKCFGFNKIVWDNFGDHILDILGHTPKHFGTGPNELGLLGLVPKYHGKK